MSKAKNPARTETRTCVLILGMHRSGTSALAGALSKLGCELPAHAMAASKSNPKGFFESTQVRDFNDELLASAGSAWDDFANLPGDWLKSPVAGKFLERAVSVLEGEFGNAQLFVLKDPRICRLVSFWTMALERFGCLVKPILIIRNPLDVSRSLLTKRGFGEPTGEMLWLRHVLEAERATRGMARFHTSFEQLMLAWETVAIQAQDGLRLTWPKSVANAEFEIAKFLSSDLRHHKDFSTRALTSPLLPGWLRETYEILNAWAEVGERAEDHQKLDRIRSEFDVASNAFARFVRAERESSAEPRQRVRELEDEVTRNRAELIRMRELEDEIKRNRVELDGLILKSEDQAHALETFEKQATLRENERASLETALASERLEIARLDSQLTAFAAEAEARQIALEHAIEEQSAAFAALQSKSEEHVANLKQSLQDERRRNTLMAAELHQQTEGREALEVQLRDVQAELAASRARRKEMAQVISRRDGAIQARYQELAALELHILHSRWTWKAKVLWRKVRHLVRPPLKSGSLPDAA